ncbi:hypothetical protein BPOR_0487g00060 [Botrytis porri]|uniref:Uncharacterized protein n=1 Tax=Botrytis porri TaxID=87229 RepID=A0A4Z1KLX7_9HELO|nr:hypothetical protein BPOR_0487g00060 [Botrytis porri]
MSSGKQSVGEVVKAEVKVTAVKYPFWFGGSASCFAACVTHPLDLVKVMDNSYRMNAQKPILLHLPTLNISQ